MKKVLLFSILIPNLALFSQAVEYYAGHERTGVDIMWYKFIQNKNQEKTPILFFSRNRASIDYKNEIAALGSVNAFSYNLKNGLGFVGVGAINNWGLTSKLGIQLYKQKGDFMFFGWAVVDLKKEGNIDIFGLFRYTPSLKNDWKIFSQLELFPVYNPNTGIWNLTQRLRLGPKYHKFSFGAMADFNQTGKTEFNQTNNFGGFIRYDF